MKTKARVIKASQVNYTVPTMYKSESQKQLVLNGLMTYVPYHPEYSSVFEEQMNKEVYKPREDVITTYKDAYEK